MAIPISLPFGVAMVAALVLGCDSTGPGPITRGIYVLQRVAGNPLPAVLQTTDLFNIRVLSDTLLLRSDGTGVISGVREIAPREPGGPAEGPFSIVTPFHSETSRGEIAITFDCPPNALCIEGPHMLARTADGGLTARWGPGISGQAPLEYELVENINR
jgi:hypothetical protein